MGVKELSLISFLLIFSFTGIIYPASGNGGNNEYSTANIPSSLRKDADAVIRKHIIKFEVKDEESAEETVTEAVTIFNKEEQDDGMLVLWYDKFRKIDDLDGELYDAGGNEIRDLNDDDIKDYGYFSEYTFYSDTREKVAELYYDKFPYTVEYKYKIYFDGYLQWPSWYSRESLDPVQLSRFEVIMHDNDSLRYWCSSDSLKPAVSSDDDRITYVWEARNLPRLSEDISGNDDEDFAGIVRIAPSKFEIDGYKGDMDSWKKFGLWYYNLGKGLDVLSDQAVRKIRSLTAPQDDTIEKIRKLYKYMQSTARYVSIQLGIGGWKPLPAQFVYDKGYGDCKALVNYMMALLKTEGIYSCPVLINAESSRPIISDFPSIQFDHVILCVPLKKDTIWLECTSSVIPFDHLSSETENKNALLISPEGGRLVHTPASSSLYNTQKRTALVVLGAAGNADVRCITAWRGDQQDVIRFKIGDMTPKDRAQWVSNSLNAPNPSVRGYNFAVPQKSGSNLKLNVKYTVPRFGSKTPHRIFFKPDLINRSSYIPPDIGERLSPVRYDYPYTDFDSVYYKIPAGYTIEAVPQEVDLKTTFGRYSAKTVQCGDTAVVYTRLMEIDKYIVPASSYGEYRDFYSGIAKSDREQVVLHKN